MSHFPKHLEVAARTGVLTAVARPNMPYQEVAMELDLTAKITELVDLGGMPVPTQDPKVIENFIEKNKPITPTDFYLPLQIAQNDIDDDQTGSLMRKFQNVLPAFQRHINARVFKVLNAGDGATYGKCYDGLNFYSNSHVDAGAKYQTVQDNLNDLALSDTNFDTVWVASKGFVDDQENHTDYFYNLLVCNQANRKIAHQIANNPWTYDTANREENPYASEMSYITSPEMDTNAWVVVATTEPGVKPLIVGIRKRPQLADISYDANQENGGLWTITYHGRYEVIYGDWRLANMGKS